MRDTNENQNYNTIK